MFILKELYYMSIVQINLHCQLCGTLELGPQSSCTLGEGCHQHCCYVLASAAGGAPPLSLSSNVRVHQTWIQHDPHVLSSTPPALSS